MKNTKDKILKFWGNFHSLHHRHIETLRTCYPLNSGKKKIARNNLVSSQNTHKKWIFHRLNKRKGRRWKERKKERKSSLPPLADMSEPLWMEVREGKNGIRQQADYIFVASTQSWILMRIRCAEPSLYSIFCGVYHYIILSESILKKHILTTYRFYNPNYCLNTPYNQKWA